MPSGVQHMFIEQLTNIVDSLSEESEMCDNVITMQAWYKTETVERMLAENKETRLKLIVKALQIVHNHLF